MAGSASVAAPAPQIQIHPLVTEEERGAIASLIRDLREIYGDRWGFVLDLRDNIAQVLRCIYSDIDAPDLTPIGEIPLIPDLSWRVTAIEKEEPMYFERADLEDPRSFYLRKTVGAQQLAAFQIGIDANVGLFSMFTTGAGGMSLAPRDIEAIHERCRRLTHHVEHIVWKLEQEVLNDAVRRVRQSQTPVFICRLFHTLMDQPVLFLEKIGEDAYHSVSQHGLEGEAADAPLALRLARASGRKLLQTCWGELSLDRAFPADQAVTAVFLKTGQHALLTLGEFGLRGKLREDFFHYIAQVEGLIQRPAYQVSTLSFLLYLQHWIRLGDRDVSDVFQHIVDNLIPFLNADFGTLALLDQEKRRIVFASQGGKLVNPLKDLPLEEGEDGRPTSILGWVFKHNKAYLAGDVRRDVYYRPFNPAIRSEMCAPIRVRGEMIGLFSVSSERADQFTRSDLGKLKFFSNQIGMALLQAGIIDRALQENERARKLDQDIKFGAHNQTHAKDLQYKFGNLVGGESGAMRAVFEAIRKINGSARDDLNVLITGETGCGKEMVAYALHNSSSRGRRPMMIANFASFGGDPNLIQSELFGHEKGSFSGATQRRIGCIEQANGSALLIDEVGDIVPSVQIKLLRVLQQGGVKTFQRLGGIETVKSNVRILAATHKDLWGEVADGRFREDLFYRLRTLMIRIPPLRERLEDVPLLAAHFSAKWEREAPGAEIRWAPGAMEALQEYHWPGNVRQLETVINRALVLYVADGVVDSTAIRESLALEREEAEPTASSLYDQARQGGDGAFWRLIHQPYRDHELTRGQLTAVVRDALAASGGSYKQAARSMGVAESEYHKFLDFLKNSGAKLDFREFRR